MKYLLFLPVLFVTCCMAQPNTYTATVTITTPGTLSTVSVLTRGATGLDFNKVAGGTCTLGTAYSIGQTCTVFYSFGATHPWSRYGGISLSDAAGHLLGNTYLTATGTAPQVSYLLAVTGQTPTFVSSSFTNPMGLAVDGNGNLYIADYSNRVIKEIAIAGGGVPASPTVNITSSGFVDPAAIAVDGSGNIYVADGGFTSIKELIAVGGVIPSSPILNSVGSGFSSPAGIAVDGNGNIYVADVGTNTVKELVAVNGVIPTSATPVTLGGGFYHPEGVAVDASGNVYVTDAGNNAVKRIPPGCVSSSCVVTLSSSFSQPRTLAIDAAGNIYVADSGNNALKQIAAINGSIPSNPTITTLATGLAHPEGVAVDSAGNIYVSNWNNNQVLQLNAQNPPSLSFASTAVGATSSDSPQTIRISNVGNSSLAFSIPATGNNPNISTSFSSGSSSTCPQVSSSSSTTGTLAAGSSCSEIISFSPVKAGSNPGTISSTDNNLGITGSVQSVSLGGTGTPGTLLVSVTSFSIPSGTSMTTLSANVSFGGLTPTGVVTFTVGATAVIATCSPSTSTETCVANYNSSSLIAGSYAIAVTVASDSNHSAASGNGVLTVVNAAPTITWTTPAPITYGTALSSLQLNASASAPGTFVYSPASGILTAGSNKLSVVFTPTSNPNNTVSASVVLVVNQATPTLTWATPSAITFGTALNATQLNASSTAPGTFVYSPASGTLTAGLHTLSVVFTLTDATDYASATGSVALQVNQATPAITWATPTPITYGTPLSVSQLNATASTPGTFAYSPGSGTLSAGQRTLSLTFTPTDTTDYTSATASVTLQVNQATPAITWAAPSPIAYGTALNATQLNATASTPGTFVYTPTSGVLTAGSHTLSVSFAPTDTTDYTSATASVTLQVNQATPTITWATPTPIPYGTALTGSQLNASASTPGTFVYTPSTGILSSGSNTLSVTFTPTDTTDFTSASASVTLLVTQATPTITWATPTPITYGTALTASQLNATASTPGTFAYSPSSGVLAAGPHTLTVTFTPSDLADYTATSASVTIQVNQATPVVTWATPATITYGTALSSTQLNAIASTPGTFTYSPSSGTLTAGTHLLSVTFTPADTADYATATASVTLQVGQATPSITWPTPAPMPYGTLLSSTQLNAIASVPGTFVYSPASGIPIAGQHTLSVTFTPTDSVDYASTAASVSLQVNPVAPTITWGSPAPIPYGTTLTAAQLNATASVPGTFVYSPASGVPNAGVNTLSVVFTPTDTTDYSVATASVTLQVNQIISAITWATPPPITYGTALSAAQLNASAPVPGTFIYSPASGILTAGPHALNVTFTPTDTVNYSAATASVTLQVNQATPTISWPIPASIPYGTPLNVSQWNATSSVAGTFSYSPATGILAVGPNTLSALFTPNDATDYTIATASVVLQITQASALLAVVTPAPVAVATPSAPVSVSIAYAGASAPSGAVSFTVDNGSAVIASCSGSSSPLQCTATYPASALAAGTHTLTASLAADADYVAASATATLAVYDDTTATALSIASSGTAAATVASGSVVTLTGIVLNGNAPVNPGTVNFCDVTTASACTFTHLLGSAQLTPSGVATFSFVPGQGIHSYQATFAGAGVNGPSTSAQSRLSVTGSAPTFTSISQNGTTGNYSLTGTVTSIAGIPVTGTVAFLDVTNSNYLLGSAPLSAGTATVSFANPANPTTGNSPAGVAIADFNSDGIKDIAVVNQRSNNVTILLGNGDGTFTTSPATPTVGAGPTALAIGDFNGDGIPDVASANNSDGTVTILLGSGDGTFTSSPTTSLVGSSPVAIAVGDFNRDGILDLAVANNGSSTITILLGNGDGTFTPTANSPATGLLPTSIATADFNGDGLPDLAISNSGSNTLTVLLGNGSGGFASAPVSPATGANPSGVTVGDFNGDGVADLAVSNLGDNSVTILLDKGDGSFTVSSLNPTGISSPASIVAGDFNADGKQDLAIADSGSSSVTILIGNGDGTFSQTPVTAIANSNPNQLAIGDLNGDGVADVVTSNTQGNSLSVLLTQQNTSVTLTGISPTGSGTHNVLASYPGDSNYTASVSSTIPLTAAPIATTLSLVSTPATSRLGQQVTLSAMLSPYTSQGAGTDGEVVTFMDGPSSIGTAVVSSGVATLSLTSLPAGTNVLTAIFPGDANFSASTGTATSTVNQLVANVVVTAPPAISYGSGPVLLSAKVHYRGSLAPSGPVSFTIDAGNPVIATCSGASSPITCTANYSTASLSAGSHSIVATMASDSDYTSVSGSNSLQVTQATVTVNWATPASITYGTALSPAQLNATATVPGTFIYTPASGVIAAGSHTLNVTFAPTDATDYGAATATVTLLVNQASPTISWATPAGISYGTALGATQLNATASTPGTFAYSPASGTLPVGLHTLSVTFTPADSIDYTTAASTVSLQVTQAAPAITWATPVAISYGTALSAAQLNATSAIPGSFTYSPASGTLAAGAHTLSVTFIPTDTINYTSTTAAVTLQVNQVTPTITWPAPAPLAYGTALSATQLDATASVPGTFAYSPASGSLTAGVHTLSVTFTPTDSTDYTTATASVTLQINQATPTIVWATPTPIAFGAALSPAQLNATASIPGSFAYSPSSGTPSVGSHTITATFTPTDAIDFTSATASVVLQVSQGVPIITWATPAAIVYGTPISSAQLNATASVPGSFAYSPSNGILAVGPHTLTVVFTPTDIIDYATAAASVTLQVSQTSTTIAWATPTPITFGTPLSAAQLNATASIPGTFAYSPASGVLTAGPHTLSVTFTPTDTTDYTPVSASVTLQVNQGVPLLNWATPAPIHYGTSLSAAQLDAAASVLGTFTYSPASGILSVGSHTLSVTFTPTDALDYAVATSSVVLQVSQTTPTITWANPTPVLYGTPLSATQLNATASTPGSFVYSPASGTLTAGIHSLSVTFTPTDTADFTTTTASVTFQVNQAIPIITWTTPAPITYGTLLGSSQFNATASVPGTFAYSPTTQLVGSGAQTLSVIFTPTDSIDYSIATASVVLQVNPTSNTSIGFQGVWAPSTVYLKGVLVSYNGVSYYSLAASNLGNEPDTSPTWWSPEPIGGTFTNVTSISGPSSGSGVLAITGGTSSGGVVQTIGTSSGTGYNQMIGSQSGNGISQMVGGSTSSSYAALLPDSSLPQSSFYCGVSKGGGTGLGQTSCNITATTDGPGYFNPVYRFALRNAQTSPTSTYSIFENGAEGCLDSSGHYTTATCGFYTPMHWYWWVFNSPNVGYTAMDYTPGPGSNPALWTAANSQWLFYSPTTILAGVSANTVGGGAATVTTFTPGAGSGSSSDMACATGHYCTAVNGTVTFTAGPSVNNSQPLFTITSTVKGVTLTRISIPDCTGYVTDFSGHAGILLFSGPTTSYQAASSSIALSPQILYTAVYTCMAN